MIEVLSIVHKNRWEEVQVRGIVHEGQDYLDIRVFKLTDEGKGGEAAIATGRGVTVLLCMLPEMIQALEEAMPYFEAKREGKAGNYAEIGRSARQGKRLS
jgi:hypothetical protein